MQPSSLMRPCDSSSCKIRSETSASGVFQCCLRIRNRRLMQNRISGRKEDRGEQAREKARIRLPPRPRAADECRPYPVARDAQAFRATTSVCPAQLRRGEFGARGIHLLASVPWICQHRVYPWGAISLRPLADLRPPFLLGTLRHSPSTLGVGLLSAYTS
jgi:hypothetical protein